MSKITHKKAKIPAPKIRFQHTGKSLTSQAGVIPVIRFLDYIRLAPTCRKHIDLKRADNARYGGRRHLSYCCRYDCRSDITDEGRFCLGRFGAKEIGGWLSIPDDSTLGRIFRLGQLRHVAQFEQVNHCLRQTVWQRALKSGVWLPGTLYRAGLMLTPRSKRFTEAGGAEKATTCEAWCKRLSPSCCLLQSHQGNFTGLVAKRECLHKQWYC